LGAQGTNGGAHAKRLRQSATTRFAISTVANCKALAEEMELLQQSLISPNRRDCAAAGRRLAIS
jgi:hypothetical protein